MNAVLPLGEAPDEPQHYKYIEHLAREWSLPAAAEKFEENITVECFQPPGYYFIGALLAAPWAQDNFYLYHNPHFSWDRPSRGYLRGPENAFPWTGPALGWHLVRFFSMILGAVTLLMTWNIALIVLKSERLAAAAMAVVALNPQFIYLHSVISNDTLATASSALLIWISLRLYREPQISMFAWTGVVIAIAAMAKVSAITILPGTLLAAGLALRRIESSRRRIICAGLLIAIPTVLAGWWFVRNVILYGDPAGLAPARQFLADNFWPQPLSIPELAGHLPRMAWQTFETTWGYFGWVAFSLPRWLYLILLAIHAIALGGLIARIPRRREHVHVAAIILTVMAISAIVAYLKFNMSVNRSGWHGRLLMPVLPIGAVAVIAGLQKLFGRWEGGLTRAVIVVFAAVLLYAMFWVFLPAYWE